MEPLSDPSVLDSSSPSSPGGDGASFSMTRRHSLSLHWPLHRRRASQSQPSSPAVFNSQNSALSPTSPLAPFSSDAEENPQLTRAEMRTMARDAWEEVQNVIENSWQWPPPKDQHMNSLPEVSIARDQLYRERQYSFTSQPRIDGESSSSANGLSPRLENGRCRPPTEQIVHSENHMNLLANRKYEDRMNTIEEMTWNSGLRTFNERRNAWTGAVEILLPEGSEPTHNCIQKALRHRYTAATASKTRNFSHPLTISPTSPEFTSPTSLPSPQDSTSPKYNSRPSSSSTTLTDRSSPSFSRPTPSSSFRQRTPPPSRSHPNSGPLSHSSRSRSRSPVRSSGADPPSSNRTRTWEKSRYLPSPSAVPLKNPHLNTSPFAQTLTPTYKPLLSPDNPLRRQSTDPKNYPAIYRSLIEESRVPNLPINLSDVVRAAVAGWKETGLWEGAANGNSAQAQSQTQRGGKEGILRSAEGVKQEAGVLSGINGGERENRGKRRRRKSIKELIEKTKVLGISGRGKGRYDGEDEQDGEERDVEAMFQGDRSL